MEPGRRSRKSVDRAVRERRGGNRRKERMREKEKQRERERGRVRIAVTLETEEGDTGTRREVRQGERTIERFREIIFCLPDLRGRSYALSRRILNSTVPSRSRSEPWLGQTKLDEPSAFIRGL